MHTLFLLNPRDLGIILTYRCAGHCRHCLYNCGPRWPDEAMSAAALREALEAVLIWPRTPQVHLTGGEPFLYFDLLLEGARMAAELGIDTYVETSGSWCTDEAQALDRFRRLRQAGMSAVLVSCSPFHAERIPLARTLRTIRAAQQVFGSQRVIVYRPEFLDILQRLGDEVERSTPLSRYEEVWGIDGARKVLWEGYGLISGGRSGYALGYLMRGHPAIDFTPARCVGELLYAHHSHFDLYGHFIPAFCGGLRVGSWQDLGQVIDDFQDERYPPLVKILVERGPYGLYEMARARYGYESRETGYAGKCHLCVDVRRHLVAADDFDELRPREFYEHIELI